MIKDQRRPAVFCRNSACVCLFFWRTHLKLFDYVIDADGKLIVFHFSFEVNAAEIGITAASSGQPWCYTSQGQEVPTGNEPSQ